MEKKAEVNMMLQIIIGLVLAALIVLGLLFGVGKIYNAILG